MPDKTNFEWVKLLTFFYGLNQPCLNQKKWALAAFFKLLFVLYAVFALKFVPGCISKGIHAPVQENEPDSLWLAQYHKNKPQRFPGPFCAHPT